jgi:menaquinone-dependent protoporphyrinogen oxidase
MRIAVLYATIEGHTRSIAERIAARLGDAGHEVALAEANAGADPARALDGAGAALLAAPIHAGQYPTPFVHLVEAEGARLAAIPTAFVSVTLAIIGEEEERREAVAYAERLTERTGWHPGRVHHAAGALRYSEYDFFKRWIMRLIARRHGYDAGKGDREFTDWAALEAFVDRFARTLATA